jgi:hypothetical protein
MTHTTSPLAYTGKTQLALCSCLVLLGISVCAWFCASVGIVFQCCWESLFEQGVVLVLGLFLMLLGLTV